MSCDYHLLPHPGIQTLHPYVPGTSVAEVIKTHNIHDVVSMASNENALGCSMRAKAALANMTTLQISSYPVYMHNPVHGKLSNKLNIPASMLLFNNGSDLLFSLILTTFALHTGKCMLTHEYAFISYQIQAQALGIAVKNIPLRQWQVDIDGLIKESQRNTALIFLANPNNPTGCIIALEKISYLLAHIPPHTILVLDEAYYEYAYPAGDETSLNLLKNHPNLIITRTFSKAYGLAGLRIGYAIAREEIISLLLRVQTPFMVNQAAMVAANAALEDGQFIQDTVAFNNAGRRQLQSGLDNLKLAYLPAHGNFISFDCKRDALPIYNALLQYGIIVRPLVPYNLANYLRVTINTSDNNQRFLHALESCMAS